jgi:hypothetical protein
MQAGTNYIYILFAIGYAVYSIVKAAKKVTANRPTINKDREESPTVKPPAGSPIPQPGDDMRKMLEDLLGGKQEEGIPEAAIPKPKPVFEKPKHQQLVPHHMERAKTASHSFDKEKAAVQEKQVTEKPKVVPKKIIAEPVMEAEPIPDFDIRQAVIFSEILKRPEY